MTMSIGLIGFGAFGAFFAPHLARHFPVSVYDPRADLSPLVTQSGAGIAAVSLAQAAACDVVVLAVPVQRLESVLSEIVPFLHPHALVIDVSSVKVKPAEMMLRLLPDSVSVIGTHPLFGPQSGKEGIAGLKMAVCNLRGARGGEVAAFLREKLRLDVWETTPEDHDRQMAYVQGLTHLIAKVVVALDLPEFQLTTKTFDYMQKMVSMVRHDSDDLFRAIERENPFAAQAKTAFFTAARQLEERLAGQR